MKILVKAVGPFGVNDGEKWFKFGKGMKSADFAKGVTYDVETFAGKSGMFINKVNGSAPSTPTLNPEINKMLEAHCAIATDTPKKFVGNALPLNEWGKPVSEYAQAKDARIARSGIIQASVQAVSAHVSNKDQLVVAAIEVAEELLKWVKKEGKE